MVPGGHVEADETAAQAAVREVAEETGLSVGLLSAPNLVVPAGFPHARVPNPWWIVEEHVPADRHEPNPHVHVDHLYVAVLGAGGVCAQGSAELRFDWYSADRLGDLEMFEDSRLLAKELFCRVEDLAAASDASDMVSLWEPLLAYD
jgi:8-oxo-dGTP pyrophosphatase MutT (NUDIX family)